MAADNNEDLRKVCIHTMTWQVSQPASTPGRSMYHAHPLPTASFNCAEGSCLCGLACVPMSMYLGQENGHQGEERATTEKQCVVWLVGLVILSLTSDLISIYYCCNNNIHVIFLITQRMFGILHYILCMHALHFSHDAPFVF